MKRNLIVLFLLVVLFMAFSVDRAEAWPGWWGPPHRFGVMRVSYYHWYPHYRPCYHYRPVYVYYPCYDECWSCYCCDGWYCWKPYYYYCYTPCWYVNFWIGWGYYSSYCYYYRPCYYAYWYPCYPPPYYYGYYYAWHGYGYHHPWHDYYWDGYGRWRDGYAYRDKPYRTGSIPGKKPHYAYNNKPKDKPPRNYLKDRKYAKAPVSKLRKEPYKLAKVDPSKSIRSSRSRDEFEHNKDRKKEGSEKRMYKTPGVREHDSPKSLDDRKKLNDLKYDGVRGKEADREYSNTKTPVFKNGEKEKKKKDEGSVKKYEEYSKDRNREKNEFKKHEPSRKKENDSKKKSSSKNKSKKKSNASKNSSSSRFSSPRRDKNSGSKVRRPSSSKRGGKR